MRLLLLPKSETTALQSVRTETTSPQDTTAYFYTHSRAILTLLSSPKRRRARERKTPAAEREPVGMEPADMVCRRTRTSLIRLPNGCPRATGGGPYTKHGTPGKCAADPVRFIQCYGVDSVII
ncbi:disintegrin and metalloproteinase domain-containing protein 9 [Anopheles sinensis]|uniref:Disintegrin and metalloproteinase domain-containing protein 9 n=1 Tax=Anopheles sinensis TaxID=74873 RepID=A0A084WTU0_ANOSI|nr:disintegrin and metalloproteinase domain-containing protein 9 [Anopheles sinensis]